MMREKAAANKMWNLNLTIFSGISMADVSSAATPSVYGLVFLERERLNERRGSDSLCRDSL